MPFLLPGQVEILRMNHDQVVALGSVVCSEVFAAFDVRRPLSIREVAQELGKSAAAVGEQVTKLLSVGLLIEAGSRKRHARTETLYVHKGIKTRFVIEDHDWPTIEAYLHRFESQMRQLGRMHSLAQRAQHQDPSLRGFMLYKWHSVYLSPENALRIIQAMEELLELALALETKPTTPPEGESTVRVTLATLMLPTTAESRARLSEPPEQKDQE